jgi:hypothetical protein
MLAISGARPARFSYHDQSRLCFGLGFVCENHPDRARSEELGCQCGAGDATGRQTSTRESKSRMSAILSRTQTGKRDATKHGEVVKRPWTVPHY